MLDDYKNTQTLAYNIMMNEIENNNIGHAYLIDENCSNESFSMVMAFVKEILSKNIVDDEKEKLFQRIDDGNYPEIKIIEPDGMLIKKQQILDLQLDFSRSAVEGNKRIYIIKDADKMRSETANSMLKFLEEPVDGITAILMTNSFNNLLSTIVSRCQVIRMANNNENVLDDDIDDVAVSFIECIEDDGIKAIMKENEKLFNVLSTKERSKYVNFFDKIVDMYYDIMKINAGIRHVKYLRFFGVFKKIANKNTKDRLLNKINYLLDAKDRIKNNVNINLLIDSIIVKFGGKDESSWNQIK